MTAEPAWGYRRKPDGSIDAVLFEDGRPDGWADSPARVDELDRGDTAPVRKRRRKVSHGNGQ